MSCSNLLDEIRGCRACAKHLPLTPNPVVQAGPRARLLLVGQAPSLKVHETGIPWDDASGDRLRQWLGLAKNVFYDSRRIAIVPMGFCYPGKAPSGDAPPRKECAPLWHARLFAAMPKVECTLLIGAYAQQKYLGKERAASLTETVRQWKKYTPKFIPLPHPSPLNNIWLKKNPWFEKKVIPEVREMMREIFPGDVD